jgi:hypothetical protein
MPPLLMPLSTLKLRVKTISPSKREKLRVKTISTLEKRKAD